MKGIMFSEILKEIRPEKVSSLWNNYGIELLVLANLVFQIILTFNGSRRRNTVGYKLELSVWVAYLLVDKVATIVQGKLMTIDIGYTQRNTHTQIQALLAPLVLMQRGSADTITAYSIDDNDQGLRHVFSLVMQVVIMFYILVRSWTDFKTSFLYIPMSLAGIIKYGETSWALRSALKSNFGFTFSDFIQYDKARGLLINEGSNDEIPAAKLILRAYSRFCWLKPHLENWLPPREMASDLNILSIEDCEYEEVFKILDSELGFMYDALYTKAPVLYTGMGLILRFISFISLIATLCGFSVLFKDAFVYNISAGMIHFVLITCVIVEIYQILRLPFSDWAIVYMIRHYQTFRILKPLLQSMCRQSATWRRWSNTMEQFDLLYFCFEGRHWYYSGIRLLRHFGWDMKLRKLLSLERVEVDSTMKELVVKELRELEKIKGQDEFTKRGEWTIQRYQEELGLHEGSKFIKDLKTTISKRSFDKSIIIWHITTKIFYENPDYHDTTDQGTKRDAIMNLSNYMMYLLVNRSHVLSTTTADIIFDYSCMMLGRSTRLHGDPNQKKKFYYNFLSCDNFFDANIDLPWEGEKKVVGNWNPVKDVRELAKSLLTDLPNEEKRWELIGSMWVEMLGYAASKCKLEYHSEHIRQGGALITHVWILISPSVVKYHVDKRDEETPATCD